MMSKIDEKLVHFANDIMSDIGEERRVLIEKVEIAEQKAYDAKELECLAKAYEMIQAALLKIDQEKNARTSKTIMDNRIKLLHKRNDLIEDTFEKARIKLAAFIKTDVYIDHLLDLIEEAKKALGEGELEVYLNAMDKEILETIEKKSKVKVFLAAKHLNFIGGCKVINVTNQRVIDLSFARKLEDLREDFLQICKLDIN
jgi:vacuolar-type H+-ATPase subunit E/Vma4